MVIAGILAWLLVLQGFAFTATSYVRFAQAGQGLGQAIFPGSENCGTPRGGDPSEPCPHDHCECCILCASSYDAGGLAWVAAIPLTGAVFTAPRIKGEIAWQLAGGENKPPTGWTSSWSQRAPPRIS